MAYNRKTWTNRESEYPNRYQMTSTNGNIANVAIIPNEGAVTSEGDKFDADIMNDMEGRINNGFTAVGNDLSSLNTTLRGLITTEATRATGEENLIWHDVRENASNLASEITRAQSAEETLATNLNAEVARAQGVESGLSTNVNSLDTRVTNAESDVATLSSRITGLETNIGLETDRAEQVETGLQTNINSVSSNLQAEIARAEGAEQQLSTDLANEALRAQAAEADLRSQVTRTYKPSGSVYFADLPALAQSRLNNVYDIRDAFITTSSFTDGAGIKYPAGTNVAIIDIDGTLMYDCLPGHNVTGVKGDAESDYRTGTVNITKANIGLGNVGNFKAVSTIANQGLTETEKQAARANIGAGSESQTVTVDTALSTTSENPVQNKVIATALNNKDNLKNVFVKETTIPDNHGYSKYLLLFDISTWYTADTSTINLGTWSFIGFGVTTRSGGHLYNDVFEISIAAAYQKATSDNGNTLRLRSDNNKYTCHVISDGTKYYLALRASGSGRNLSLIGRFIGTYIGTWVECTDSNGTMPSGWSVVISNSTNYSEVRNIAYDGNTLKATREDDSTFNILTRDTTPTSGSSNLITSGGVYNYIDTMITQAISASY